MAAHELMNMEPIGTSMLFWKGWKSSLLSVTPETSDMPLSKPGLKKQIMQAAYHLMVT